MNPKTQPDPEETISPEIVARKYAFEVIKYCAERAYDKIQEKIEALKEKIQNEQVIKELRKRAELLIGTKNTDSYKRKINPIFKNLKNYFNIDTEDENLIDMIYLDLDANFFKPIFRTILRLLGIPRTLGDNLCVYGKNFVLYCNYLRYRESGEIDELKGGDPASLIMRGEAWRDGNNKETMKRLDKKVQKDYEAIKPRFFFIFEYLTDIRNKKKDEGRFFPLPKDVITHKHTHISYFAFASMYIFCIYAFDELLDLMVKYLPDLSSAEEGIEE